MACSLLFHASQEWDRVDGINPVKSRSFGITDAMIVIAAVAVALSANRMDRQVAYHNWRADKYEFVTDLLILVLPHACAMTAALVAIRMRRHRSTLRRLARQPGSLACIVAGTALLVVVCWVVFVTATGRHISFFQEVSRLPNGGGRGRGGKIMQLWSAWVLTVFGDRIGFAVAGAWLYLLLFGLWRPERTWIDRLCCAMGWIWLVLTAALWLRSLLI
jgi:hypothetical protein